MPSPVTHYLCGDKTLRLLEQDELRELIAKRRKVFNLGTQGPDILFYHSVWPWAKKQGIDKVGGRMHSEHVRAFFSRALEYIKSRALEEQSLLTAYLCGYVCHYALDTSTHPYIFYKTGFVRSGEPKTSRYTSYHRMFETAVDVLMLERLLKMCPSELKIHEQIRIDSTDAQHIGSMYEAILQGVYDERVDAQHVCRAISDMVSAQAILRDPTGVKKKLLSWLEDRLGIYHLISGMIYPKEINDGLDYLNLRHSCWLLPWDNRQEHTSSFIEMFDTAAQKAVELCEAIFYCISGRMDISTALDRIGNNSFSTGIDCYTNVELKYYDCIYKPMLSQ